MENEHIESGTGKENSSYALPIAIVLASAMLSGAWIYTSQGLSTSAGPKSQSGSKESRSSSVNTEAVLPSKGVVLPVTWDNFGAKLVSVGAIDGKKFQDLYALQGQFTEEYKKLLLGNDNGALKITQDNAGFLLNLFWALGLSSKNPILESGEIANKAYGGVERFASTAGWTIAEGSPIDHFSRHMFFELTPEQQALVDKVSKGIYRPCCDNSTHFPDCNHGMAMLGLLELMASQGVSEEEMWKAALAVNSYWFPDMYITLAAYMKSKGIEWKDVNPQEVLGINYSSASGYTKVASQVVKKAQQQGGSGCGVDTGQTAVPQRQQSGCGL